MKMAITWTSEKRKFAPLIFTGNLDKSMEEASNLGYKGMELSVRTGRDIPVEDVKALLDKYGMEISNVGTGLARGEDGLSFSDRDERTRKRAVERLKEQIDFAAQLKAPVVFGLIRGDLETDENVRKSQLHWIIDCAKQSTEYANKLDVDIIVEPINRYETNFLNTIQESVEFAETIGLPNVGVMGDTFHMNIEERDFVESLQQAGKHLKYVHLADSNRWPPGRGHIDFARIIATLKQIGYGGYLSIECLPNPDPMTAARQAIEYVTPLIS